MVTFIIDIFSAHGAIEPDGVSYIYETFVPAIAQFQKTVVENDRPYKGFNLFTDDDQKIFESIASREFNISGFQNKNLRVKLAHKTTAQISIIIKRLISHGLLKKIGHSYKYYLT